MIEICEHLRQGSPLSPVLLNVYIDSVIKDWKKERKQNVLTKVLNKVLFADDRVMLNTDNNIQSAVCVYITHYSRIM
jgi:hypothetical protein